MAACAQDSSPLCLLADLKGVGVLVGLPPGLLSHLLLPISEDPTYCFIRDGSRQVKLRALRTLSTTGS